MLKAKIRVRSAGSKVIIDVGWEHHPQTRVVVNPPPEEKEPTNPVCPFTFHRPNGVICGQTSATLKETAHKLLRLVCKYPDLAVTRDEVGDEIWPGIRTFETALKSVVYKDTNPTLATAGIPWRLALGHGCVFLTQSDQDSE